MRRCLVAASAAIMLAAGAASADAGEVLLPLPPPSQTVPPKGFSLSARQAIAVAKRNPNVRDEEKSGPLAARALVLSNRSWVVNFRRDGDLLVQVRLDARTNEVSSVTRGRELLWPVLAGGQRGPRVQRLHAIMIVTGLVFFAVFFDPRRWLRWLHLDLLALLGLGASLGFADAGHPYAATPLMYPPLVYLAARMIWVGYRGPAQEAPEGRLTWAGPRMLLGGLAVVLAARYAWAIFDGVVNDIGYGSLYGADSIRQGYELYNSAPGQGDLDTYGPFMYVAYIPFLWLFPFDLAHAHSQGAQAAAIVWDAATIGCLYLLGARLRPGTALGVTLAFAYAVCPWTWLPLEWNTNDGLVSLLLVITLLVAASPAWRGLSLGLAVAAKFGPAIVGPLFARGPGERGARPLLEYIAAAVLPFAVLVLAFMPDGGPKEFWDATIGFQLHREAPSSLWGLWPDLKPLQYVVQACALGLAAVSFWLPRERTVERLAACGAALLIAAQLSTVYWYYFYVVWFLPYLLVALFSTSYAGSVRNSGSSSAKAVAMNSS